MLLDWIINSHTFLLNSYKFPTLTVNPVLPPLPLKLQFNLCLDTLLIFGIAFVLLLQRKKLGSFYSAQAFTTSIFTLLIALVLNLEIQGTLYSLSKTTGQSVFPIFWDSFSISKYNLKLKSCLYLGNLFLLSFAFDSFKNSNKKSNLYFLIPLTTLFLTATGSMLLTTSNLFTLLLAIETFSFLSLFIIRFSTNKMSSEASLLYFFMNLLATGFLSLGLLFIYLGTNSITLFEIADILFAAYNSTEKTTLSPNLFIGCGLIFGVFLFKLAAFPCFFWLPLTFRAMTFSGIALTSFSVKFVNVCLFIQLTLIVLPSLLTLISTNIWISLISFSSIFTGTILALKEFNFRKFLAFTSINQIGYIILALLPLSHNIVTGLYNLMYFISIYFVSVLLFLSTLSHIRINNNPINNLSDLRLLWQSSPFSAAICLLSIFSMAGLPPTSGFWAKYYILRNCWDLSSILSWGEAINMIFRVGIITIIFLNFISAIYYVRLIILISFDPIILLFTKLRSMHIRKSYSIFSKFLLEAFSPLNFNFRRGLKYAFITDTSTLRSIIREVSHATLDMEVIKVLCQSIGAFFLILDFFIRCW